jgi:hypothetical protein
MERGSAGAGDGRRDFAAAGLLQVGGQAGVRLTADDFEASARISIE